MKTAEIRALSDQELQTRLMEAREEFMNLRFQHATGELTDYTRLRHTRRTIARISTILNERRRLVEMEGEV